MPARLKIDSTELYNLYITQRISSTKIAKMFGTYDSTILNHLKRNNIPRRTSGESQKGKISKFQTVSAEQLFNKNILNQLYIDQRVSIPKISKILFSSKSFVRNMLIKFNIPIREDYEAMKGVPKTFPNGVNSQIARFKIPCGVCGKLHEKTQYTAQLGKISTCSRACTGKLLSLNYSGSNSWHFKSKSEICCICNKEYFETPKKKKNRDRWCSRECYLKYNVGSNTFRWKGGNIEYYGPNWHKQKKLARIRDENLCQRCGRGKEETGYNMSVHHITPFRDFGLLYYPEANNLQNLICYCGVCHHRVEFGGAELYVGDYCI